MHLKKIITPASSIYHALSQDEQQHLCSLHDASPKKKTFHVEKKYNEERKYENSETGTVNP